MVISKSTIKKFKHFQCKLIELMSTHRYYWCYCRIKLNTEAIITGQRKINLDLQLEG